MTNQQQVPVSSAEFVNPTVEFWHLLGYDLMLFSSCRFSLWDTHAS